MTDTAEIGRWLAFGIGTGVMLGIVIFAMTMFFQLAAKVLR